VRDWKTSIVCWYETMADNEGIVCRLGLDTSLTQLKEFVFLEA